MKNKIHSMMQQPIHHNHYPHHTIFQYKITSYFCTAMAGAIWPIFMINYLLFIL
jgi:hypothetical protein